MAATLIFSFDLVFQTTTSAQHLFVVVVESEFKIKIKIQIGEFKIYFLNLVFFIPRSWFELIKSHFKIILTAFEWFESSTAISGKLKRRIYF